MSNIEIKSAERKDFIFELLKESKVEDAIKYIKDGHLDKNIDCIDEHGTTPLQYAVRILLRIGFFDSFNLFS